jgi:hypothetical protein
MTKLAYDYDCPENNAKVRITRAKLPPRIGQHIEDKKRRALYREGYAVAKAFGFTWAFGIEDGDHPYPYLQLEKPVELSALQRPNEFWRTAAPDDPYRAFHAGVTDGAKDRPASRDAEAKLIAAEDAIAGDDDDEPEEEICNTCRMARELHAYMTFRAKREGVGHQLDGEFYRSVLHAGTQVVFGVTFDVDKGVILSDAQNPEALEVWLDTCRCCGKSIKESYRDHEGEAEAQAA